MAGRFAGALVWTATGAVVALCAALVLRRVFGFPMDWGLAGAIAGGAALVAAAVWTIVTRPSHLAVARAVDERAGLREAISTALCVGGMSDPWSKATVAHAVDASRRVHVRQAFPARAPRMWPAPFVAAAAFGLLLLLPQGDVLGWLEKARAAEAEQQAVTQAKVEVKEHEEEVKKALEALNDPRLDLDAGDQEANAPEPTTPEEIRQSAVKKLTSVQDRLNEMRQSGKGLEHDALKEQMRQLKQPGAGPLNDLVAALQKGDFKQANEELAKLAEQMAKGELTAEQQEAIQKQLEELAKQLEKLAEMQSALAQKLEELGLDPSLATDPKALAEALKNMQGLSEAQKKQLMEMAEACEGACKACDKMGQCMSKAAQAMKDGNAAGAMGELGDMMSELEMLQSEMDAADAALKSIGGKLAQLGQCSGGGQYKFDMWQLWSQPKNVRGQGGDQEGVEEADYTTQKEKAPTPTQAGPIIGTRLIEGSQQVKGESKAQFTQVVSAGSEAAAEAIEDNTIPRELHDAVKRYFGRLEAKVKPEQAGTPSDEPSRPGEAAPPPAGESPAEEGAAPPKSEAPPPAEEKPASKK